MYEDDDTKLVPFTSDLITEKYLSWFNNPDICTYTSHCIYPMTKDRAIEYVNSINNPKSDTIVFSIMVCSGYEKTEKLFNHVGNICLTSINLINRSAEIGIIIGEDVKKKGVGTKALKMILKHGFYRLNLQRIWLGTSIQNISMQKVAEKVGMKLEGTLKNALFCNGRYVDDLLYGIIRYRYDRIYSKCDLENQEEQ